MEAFWGACAAQGIVSKALTIRRTPHTATPVRLCLAEAAKHGAPLITVPYNAVFNCQTLRGDLCPAALPPLRKVRTFLTRRGRMGSVTADELWLAAFLACHHAAQAHAGDAAHHPLHDLLTRTVYPPLPNLFVVEHAPSCPSLRGLSAPALQAAERKVLTEVEVTHAMLRHYAKRRGVAAGLCPSKELLTQARRTVMQRAMLLPWNGEPSAPGDLSELTEASPDLPLLPSLVPAIDMIQAAGPASASKTAGGEGEQKEEESVSARGNCSLITCVQSDFVNAESRRRVIVETAPLASRRVVACATRPLKEGDELLMDFE